MADAPGKKVTDADMWDAMRTVHTYVKKVPRPMLPRDVRHAMDTMELGFEHYMVVVPTRGNA